MEHPMSKPLSPREVQLVQELGSVTEAAKFDPIDVRVATLVRNVRGEIAAAARDQGLGVREIARRLGVSAAAVSRHLRSEGDMRLSTAELFAIALGKRWQLSLMDASCTNGRDQIVTPVVPDKPASSVDHKAIIVGTVQIAHSNGFPPMQTAAPLLSNYTY